MRCSLILLATIAGAGVAGHPCGGAATGIRNPPVFDRWRSTLDKNYGMPPLPNADQMPQRTMAPENRVPPQPDFFGKTTELRLAGD